jgi:small nuclear ribonucleoprotein (snRNP)-like protein
MTIDLSEFIGKTVDITLRNGESLFSTLVEVGINTTFPYNVLEECYKRDGSWDYVDGNELDIVEIKLSTPEPKPIIDLSKYVDKKVKVTTYGNHVYVGLLHYYGDDKVNNSYVFHPQDRPNLLYYEDGNNYFSAGLNIVKIEILNENQAQNQQQKANSLDPQILHTIASALTPEAIKFVESHEKYAEVIQALIIEFVEKNLGSANGELPFMIFDQMYLAKGGD